jgi:hypothetical protein
VVPAGRKLAFNVSRCPAIGAFEEEQPATATTANPTDAKTRNRTPEEMQSDARGIEDTKR